MSYIRFQDLHGSAHLNGPERPHLYNLIHEHARRTLFDCQDAGARAYTLFDLLPQDHELREVRLGGQVSPHRWLGVYARTLQTSIFDDPIVDYRGHQVRPLTLLLNTAMDSGTEPLRLAARLMGQCEINTWVDGPNRRWLAGVITQGLASGDFRADCGWHDVQRLLLARDDHPVVVSWSDSFPSYWNTALHTPDGKLLDGEEAEQLWETMPAAEQWAHGLRALKDRSAELLEMTPDWAGYRFGSTVSLGDLLATDHIRRLDRAFELAG
ncbi:hypothetical protein AB0393_28430 [Streptomyces cyaneofuscatus]|uniref:hypothetical protein n=1 Tax=Streptomyces cyaneofuscatus TaxID=66883 RepID=UPI00344B59B5